MKKRYQECNVLVKLCRRLKYQPYYFVRAVFKYLHSRITNSKAGHELFDSKILFSLYCGEWATKANWWYTPEEVRQNLEKELLTKKNDCVSKRG